jgi:hypothetical protein
MKIAGRKTIKEWEDLVGKVGEDEKLKIDYNSNEKWDEVFDFFEERIKTRYINPINAILNMKSYNGEGFAVVNLQCSLIETIESFINGWVYSHKPRGWFKNGQKSEVINNACIFKSFFANRIIIKDLKIDGGDFYESVRCGLLHETQTKNNWKINLDTEKIGLSYDEKDGKKIIYRENFQKDLELLIEEYKKAIIFKEKFCDIEPKVLRENFIAKFNHICTESKT